MIPTYNRTTCLERTLSSVLSQDPGAAQMQIEVVDNDSTADDPEPLVRQVGGDRVSFVRQPRNIGMTSNWNSCIERSVGEWVHILHDDDMVFPGFYERLKRGLMNRFDVGAGFCRHAFIDENDHWLCTSELEKPTAGILPDFIETIGARQRIECASIVVRRSVYEKLGGFLCGFYLADWEMWNRIAAHYPIWYEPATLAAYRQHSKSANTALARSGEILVHWRRALEINRTWMPPDRAEAISRKAKEFVYGMELSSTSNEDAVLRLVEELVKVSMPRPINRSVVANALLRAAHIHYRNGRPLLALAFVVRAVLTRPIIAGRPLKRVVDYLFGKSRVTTGQA
jgi:glycosyltransferase involved in cell wall biosynthesis